MFQKPLVSNKLYGMSNCLEIYQCIHYRWEKTEQDLGNKKQDILTLCQDYYYDGTCQCQNKLSDLYPLSVSWSTELFQDFLHPNKEFHYPVEINRCMEEIGHRSVGRAPVCCAGGRGFEPQTGPTLTVLK